MAKQDKGWDKTFINVPLSVEDKVAIKAWIGELSELDDLAVRLIEENIRVNLTYDTFNLCFSCTLSRTDDKHPDAKLMLSGKGSTPLKALKQAMYIHWKLLDKDWTAYSQTRLRTTIDD